MTKEIRTFSSNMEVERRSEEQGGGAVIRGYASVFNSDSENLGGFIERIDSHAFDDVLTDDVRCLFNHNPDHLLARTKSRTLTLSVDQKGLMYECELPNTRLGQDLLELMERGDIAESSFAFSVDQEDWDEQESGLKVRTIKKVKRLYDVSPVTYPAYPDATVAKRSLEEFQKRQQSTAEELLDVYRRRLRLTD